MACAHRATGIVEGGEHKLEPHRVTVAVHTIAGPCAERIAHWEMLRSGPVTPIRDGTPGTVDRPFSAAPSRFRALSVRPMGFQDDVPGTKVGTPAPRIRRRLIEGWSTPYPTRAIASRKLRHKVG